MPLVNVEDNRMKVALAVLAMLAAWLAFQSGMLAQVAGPIVANAGILSGVVLVLLLGWWALDEAEDDDDATDVIEKTATRAETVILGAVAVLLTFGGNLLDLLGSLVELLAGGPLIASNLGAGLAGIAGALGFVSPEIVGGIVVVLLFAALIARDRGAGS